MSSVFFFQAEDGIRDVAVTGVQTCALPISYTRARVVVAHRDTAAAFRRAARGARHLKTILVLGDNEFDERLARAPAALDPFPTHRDDAAIWLFSGGTTGQDRKSTRLNSSHGYISYAVFCFKKK